MPIYVVTKKVTADHISQVLEKEKDVQPESIQLDNNVVKDPIGYKKS